MNHFCANLRAGASAALLPLLLIAPGCPAPGGANGAASGAANTAAAAASSDSGTSGSTATVTTSTVNTSAATTAPTVITGTPRAVKIIFSQTYPSGSFDAAPASGTAIGPGHGHAAVRVFNPDGSLLSSSSTAASWPKWLSRFEIGVSGSSNTSATNAACAKFADLAESSATANCLFNTTPTKTGCGAAQGLYRVSEYDCLQAGSTISDGTGGPNDGVYLRATFDRTQLGTGENLMAVFEYVASSFQPAPLTPSNCMVGGALAPENCSNVTWKAFIKHNVNEMVQPFLMLMPPTQNYVNTALGTSGATPTARQFYIPLSADPSLAVLQISRIHSNLTTGTTGFGTACNATGTLPANSPLCAGVILYSLTLYRI